MKAVILKGIGGFYYVKFGGEVYECRARGKFRADGIKPVPGDEVEFSMPTETSMGYVEEILPRRNLLTRPAVANVDALMIVVSAKKPAPDWLLVDKLLLYAAHCNIKPALVINKIDQNQKAHEQIGEYANSGAEIFLTSAETGEGLEAVESFLKGKCTAFAGQSAVGKSSLLNRIAPELDLKTGGLSKKTARGRHTTRHSELFYVPRLDATVVDTPGFSILESMDVSPDQLSAMYPELDGVQCRFASCVHKKEPDCGVKEKVENGEIPRGRYERYLQILDELLLREEKKYD